MTDRERLIEIVKNSLIKHIGKSCCLAENIVDDLLAENVTTLPIAFSDNRRERMIELLDGYYEETGINIVHYFTDEESEMLADYILADGWTRPPCKVGDTVWVYDFMWGLIPCKVDRPYHCICGEEGGCTFEMSFTDDDFGKTVFLTIEAGKKVCRNERI